MKDENEHRLVVKIETSFFERGNSVCEQKSMRVLRRKSVGFDLLAEEVGGVGPEDTLKSIIGWHDAKPGEYELRAVNISRDWESGYVDGYDLKLFPVDETQELNGQNPVKTENPESVSG